MFIISCFLNITCLKYMQQIVACNYSTFTYLQTPHIQQDASDSRSDTYACHICGKQVTRLNSLRRHVRMHKGIYPYHCRVCNRGFGSKVNLLDHMRWHSGERLTCEQCLRQFVSKVGFLSHQEACSGFKK